MDESRNILTAARSLCVCLRKTAMNQTSATVMVRVFMSSKRSHKYPLWTHKIGTFTFSLDNHEKF